MVLEYRSHWEKYGFEVRVTPNEDIRNDVKKLANETQQNHLLEKFDNLKTRNMQFDFWRFSKLYLVGGTYADVDIDPKSHIEYWQQKAKDENSVVIFEESATIAAHSKVIQFLRPFVSNFQEFPSYASCVIIAPRPKAPFFLDVLNAVDMDQWSSEKEPRRTLMTTGPGLLTRVAKTRKTNDIILASRADGLKTYSHNGFGTWKSSSTKRFEQHSSFVSIIALAYFLWKTWKTRKHWSFCMPFVRTANTLPFLDKKE